MPLARWLGLWGWGKLRADQVESEAFCVMENKLLPMLWGSHTHRTYHSLRTQWHGNRVYCLLGQESEACCVSYSDASRMFDLHTKMWTYQWSLFIASTFSIHQ
ncbi:uncharacterized protein EI90DRAFT_277931 [Cantharellus anzutake]|uniref:uncharacterized protein n=1 Tax=Cantharellus anzutake TaxID=1750568 RepID=UPI0019063101|nr:uncharacterized protein EI90DRAFT_277931 [Cantharellus anzutake]KAF8335931.1 hypothetical protein EI90DRAFT_277931 [Cantharellus anzutake]